jgi:hypothetical protein
MGHIGRLGERRYQACWVDPKWLGVLQKSSPVATSPRTRSPSLRSASLMGATSTTRTRSRLPSTPGIGHATRRDRSTTGKAGQVLLQVPIASTKLGARKVSGARPSEVHVDDRAVADPVSRHRAAPEWSISSRPRDPTQRMFCRRASLISARPTARADTSVATPGARSIASHRCIAPRSVTLALATHSLAVSADTCVLRRGLVVPSTVCVFGVLGVSGEGGKC